MARPPARLGDLTSFGAAPRSPPVPSGPSGALHTGGACASDVPGQAPPPPTSAAAWPCLEARPCPLVPPAPSTPAVPAVLVCPARPRRRPRAPQLTLTNFARNSPAALSNLECTSLELQCFQRLLKLPSNELRASFPGLAVYQDPRQTVEAIVRPGPRYRRVIPMCLGAIVEVFVPRYETDSTFASTSLQRNETAIAFASDERPFLGHFDPAKVLSVSMGRAVWRAKVLSVSMGRAVWRAKVLVVLRGRAAWRAKVLPVSKLRRHRVLCAKKFALRGPEWV